MEPQLRWTESHVFDHVPHIVISILSEANGEESAVNEGRFFVAMLLGMTSQEDYSPALWPINLSAHWMKYIMLGASVCPPSCWRQASSPSSRPWFTGGIWAVWQSSYPSR